MNTRRIIRIGVLVAAGLLSLALPRFARAASAAQSSGPASPTPGIRQLVADDGSEPMIVTDREGHWLVLWVDNITEELVISRFSDAAAEWSTPETPAGLVGSKVAVMSLWRLFALAPGPDGDWLLAWLPKDCEEAASCFLQLARSTDEGQTWSSPAGISADPRYAVDKGVLDQPHVVYLSKGYLVTWTGIHRASPGISWPQTLVSKEVARDNWSVPQALPVYTEDFQLAGGVNGYLLAAAYGGSLVRSEDFGSAWTTIEGLARVGETPPDYSNPFDPMGMIESASGVSRDQEPPAIAQDERGNWLLAAVAEQCDAAPGRYQRCSRPFPNPTIYVSRSLVTPGNSGAGEFWSRPAPAYALAAPAGSGSRAAITDISLATGGGRWGLVWREETQVRDGLRQLAKVSYSDDFGQTWSTPELLNPPGRDTWQRAPGIATDGVQWMFAWLQSTYRDFGVHDAVYVTSPSGYRVGEELPLAWASDKPDDVDWTQTKVNPQASAILVPALKKAIVADWGQAITIEWRYRSELNRAPARRRYLTLSTPTSDVQVLYFTYNGASQIPGIPFVDLSSVSETTIHYNASIPRVALEEGKPDTRHVWIDESRHLQARSVARTPAYVLLEYTDISPAGVRTFGGLEVVQVKPNAPDVPTGNVSVGGRLLPTTRKPGFTAEVTRGAAEFIYKHEEKGAAQAGQVWAVRPNDDPAKMEVVWRRTGVKGILWPYELRRYQAAWPKDAPARYQLFVRSDRPGMREPRVLIPSGLNPVVKYEEIAAGGHAALDPVSDGQLFGTDGPGWTLLQYQVGPQDRPGLDWVGFEVVRSVQRTDPAVFDPTPQRRDVGAEITHAQHEVNLGQPTAQLPGYIYDPDSKAPYDPEVYATDTITGTGQIFAVNEGRLEVWWRNLSRLADPDGAGWPAWPKDLRVQWPSRVVLYDAVWPAQADHIVLARQIGSGLIDETVYGSDWNIYRQNNPARPGFNPNDEHAAVFDAGDGRAIFALRDDLATPATSKPYVLMRYREQPAGDRWRFRLFQVLREEGPYVLRDWAHMSSDPTQSPPNDPYEAIAGRKLKAPFPEALFVDRPNQNCPESSGASGPWFKDRKSDLWARAAGDDGRTAQVAARFYYPLREGFYFPDPARRPGDCVPWLPGADGQPVAVTYTVKWPDRVPEMLVGETLIRPMRNLPAIGGAGSSTDVIYQQSLAQGRGSSVSLIDPVQARKVDLPNLSAETKAFPPGGSAQSFPRLSPALQMRVEYDNDNKQLVLKGWHPDAGGDAEAYNYTVLNVLSDAEFAELQALSTDTGWQKAVKGLFDKARAPVVITDSNQAYEELALTSGLADGAGYVTLAMNNAGEPRVGKDSPVSLAIIKVIPELAPGRLHVVEPACAFDEVLTLRHTGDFAGQQGNYQFRWFYTPDEDGGPRYPVEQLDKWTRLELKPTDRGANSVSISGAGLLMISDNWFVVQYRRTGSSLPWNDRWSALTDARLAPGWIKRVLGKVNPFTQRGTGGLEAADKRFFRYGEGVNTVVSMISQAGAPPAGSVPLSCGELDTYGLLQIYRTVLDRGRALSIDAAPAVDYGPANQALLLVASRIADLYALLGNEAYADAADPTVALGVEDNMVAPTSVRAFTNVTSSLLEEELTLLRGQSPDRNANIQVGPVYNRLRWNFTQDGTGGETAYALNYDILDSGQPDGRINEADARSLYPQGHGDAWGYYLSALQTYYRLLRHKDYTWRARAEAVNVGDASVQVDYLDERKFARAAAAKARTGAEIVNLTYRDRYVEEPDAQWQGYKDDEDPARAWGLAEWASRAGQGAYIDWVAGNAMLPAAAPAEKTGIAKIDRTTVPELGEIAARYAEIQDQVDTADLGLNPLGLAANVVPFDILPELIAPRGESPSQTHFEQVYARAVEAVNNAVAVFNYANGSTQRLRKIADDASSTTLAVREREADFESRLIEVFGYPYPDDIGPGKTYDRQGPDLYHYAYVDRSELTGERAPASAPVPINMTEYRVADDGSLKPSERVVMFHLSTVNGRPELVKPKEWKAPRKAPGEIQVALSELFQMRGRFEKALVEYDNLLASIQDQAELLRIHQNVNARQITVLEEQAQRQRTLDSLIVGSRAQQLRFRTNARMATIIADATAEALPTSAGLSVDPTSLARSAIRLAGAQKAEPLSQQADDESLVELDQQQAATAAQAETNIRLTALTNDLAVEQQLRQLEQAVRQERGLRIELSTLAESLAQTSGRYLSALARGQRLLEERERFRRETAAQVQQRRYRDMAFRIFRNDALQKYRAQFDLAARYVYLAAKAYDYETAFVPAHSLSGAGFLTSIVGERQIGTIEGGVPLSGGGLAGALRDMKDNFSAIKGQMGFDTPQRETNRFSLRRELLRIADDDAAGWRQALAGFLVPNLRDLPEYERYAAPPNPNPDVQPGIVIPFGTTVTNGLNFFGRPIEGQDSFYNSSNFATKVRSVGVWFEAYPNNLVATPFVYVIPVGVDMERSPDTAGAIREFSVLDQRLPPPIPVKQEALSRPDWLPSDTFNGPFAEPWKHRSFRAFFSGTEIKPGEMTPNTRLVGRSVWNTRWLLIIPAGSLHNNATTGLGSFLDKVTDIQILFETYAYPGN